MISKALAEKFIEQVTECTPYNVNIMDGEGIIIASRDPNRLGQYHEIAYRIIHGKEDIVDTTKIGDYTNVRPGINMVIAPDGVREGVVGVTGEPEEIRPVALMIKMAMESMLRYEKQQETIRLRENRKERFVHLLTEVEGADPEELRSLAAELNYISEHATVLSALGIVFPFLLAAILKSAQGSSTVALTTTAGIVAPLLPVLGFETPVQIALVCMAIGAGAMTVSHANDSYYWVVTNFGAMSPDRGYKTWTVASLIMGVASIIEILILSFIFH